MVRPPAINTAGRARIATCALLCEAQDAIVLVGKEDVFHTKSNVTQVSYPSFEINKKVSQ